MLVKATVIAEDTLPIELCNESDEAKDLFNIWIACSKKDADTITWIKRKYNPREVQFVGNNTIFVSKEKKFILFDGENFPELSPKPLAGDN